MNGDPAQSAVGSEFVFERAGVRRTFRRLPGGWSEVDNWFSGGRYLDDASFADEGWKPVD